MPAAKQRAPTLYAIIGLKLLKGLILLSLALGVYNLADNNLPETYDRALRWIRIDPEKKFFSNLAIQVARITPANVMWVATGTFLYSLFSLVEGIGLIFRVRWAGWLAIGESAFFIPIEIYELGQSLSLTLTIILMLNTVIVVYLFRNRERLFQHHH
jgi:uncharacterized membrane protein (DUF2068 family)